MASAIYDFKTANHAEMNSAVSDSKSATFDQMTFAVFDSKTATRLTFSMILSNINCYWASDSIDLGHSRLLLLHQVMRIQKCRWVHVISFSDSTFKFH